MISKFASMKDSLFTKIILTVTALSFMSLFGVSGYINSANNNKVVLQVDDLVVTQSEFAYLVQRELAKLRNAGIELDEDGEQKDKIIRHVAQSKLDDLIIENMMKKHNIDFTDSLIRNIIMVSPQFLNQNGQFDHEAYKWYLNQNGQNEQELIAEIKRNVARKILIDSQVSYANVPLVLLRQMQKVIGQRRTFSYAKIVTADAAITRQPDAEELDSLYEEMSEELTIPEKRHISVMFIPTEVLEAKIEVTPEEIAAYYKEHIEEYEQPEQRLARQLVFEDKAEAEAAAAKLAQGADFMAVAAEYNQAAVDVELGLVTKADLSEELADVIFSLKKGQISDVIEIADSWQILEVTDIKAAHKVDRATAEAEIVKEIRQDQVYDNSYDIAADIEDKLGAGTTLEDIAQSYGVNLVSVKNLDENGNTATGDKQLAQILSENKDFIDSAFSYNEGETTQVVEDDNGLLVARIEKIIPAHVMPREDAAAKLQQYWQENERNSVTQELLENIDNDINAGDDFATIAKRYNLRVVRTMPISRGENFADLPLSDIKTLFQEPQDEIVVLPQGNDHIVAVTTKIYDNRDNLTEEDGNFLIQAMHGEISREMADALLRDFASEYKVEVNYNRMGLNN